MAGTSEQRSSSSSSDSPDVRQQYRLLHDIYVLLDDGDRRFLQAFGINPSQYNLLTLLESDNGKRLTALGERLLMPKSTVTRIVDQLEQAGLIQRIPDPHDRRAQRVVLTPKGALFRERVLASHDLSLEHRTSVLTQEEHEELGALLRTLRQGLSADLGKPDRRVKPPVRVPHIDNLPNRPNDSANDNPEEVGPQHRKGGGVLPS